MGYCLCGRRDLFSLSLGLISVVSWGVAEVPQLITNYTSKSAEGLSILFLMAWIVGRRVNDTVILGEVPEYFSYNILDIIGSWKSETVILGKSQNFCRDFLNFCGCILEPATLPTQYYTALLYTITTFILFSQAVYYGHIYPQLKSNKQQEVRT